MDSPVFAELAWAAASRGHPTLRFNHRGVGGSQGERGTGGELLRDADAALTLLLENTLSNAVAVVALNGGAATALRLQREHRSVGGLVLLNPRDIAPSELPALACPLLLVIPEHGSHLPRAALAAASLEANGRLEVLAGADAAFAQALPALGDLVAAFLSEISRNP